MLRGFVVGGQHQEAFDVFEREVRELVPADDVDAGSGCVVFCADRQAWQGAVGGRCRWRLVRLGLFGGLGRGGAGEGELLLGCGVVMGEILR